MCFCLSVSILRYLILLKILYFIITLQLYKGVHQLSTWPNIRTNNIRINDFFLCQIAGKKKKKLIREKNIMILQLVTNAYQINVV